MYYIATPELLIFSDVGYSALFVESLHSFSREPTHRVSPNNARQGFFFFLERLLYRLSIVKGRSRRRRRKEKKE